MCSIKCAVIHILCAVANTSLLCQLKMSTQAPTNQQQIGRLNDLKYPQLRTDAAFSSSLETLVLYHVNMSCHAFECFWLDNKNGSNVSKAFLYSNAIFIMSRDKQCAKIKKVINVKTCLWNISIIWMWFLLKTQNWYDTWLTGYSHSQWNQKLMMASGWNAVAVAVCCSVWQINVKISGLLTFFFGTKEANVLVWHHKQY